MRSSNYKHLSNTADRRNRRNRRTEKKKAFKFSSIIITVFVLMAVAVPSVTLIQNADALTDSGKVAFSIGDANDFSDAIAVKEVKVEKATEAENEAETEPETEAEEEYYEEASSDYSTEHVELSEYDRDLLERLVMGEAGTLGYEGCALVAQAVRDSMLLSGTTSVEEIIATYQYDGDTYTEPNETVKEAVSYIFDEDGYAVDHRILYFYACDQVSSDWHEEQQFITECGNVRFFDRW